MTTAPVEIQEPDVEEVTVTDEPWIVIVWNDPVNLMSYVVYVFQKLFGYSRKKATKLMRQVHEEGKAVVSDGTGREVRGRRRPPPRARPVGDDGTPVVVSASTVLMARWKRFRAGRDDTLVVSLRRGGARPARARCPSSCATCSRAPTTIPRAARLFPRAYLDPTAETEEAEWQALGAPVAAARAARRARADHRHARRARRWTGDWWQIDARRPTRCRHGSAC